MTGGQGHEPGETQGEPLDIALDSVEREFSDMATDEVFSVGFLCSGQAGEVDATVTVPADTPTVEIVPTAMSELHRLFAALAAQTRGWLKGGG